jgi:hypothetical protein
MRTEPKDNCSCMKFCISQVARKYLNTFAMLLNFSQSHLCFLIKLAGKTSSNVKMGAVFQPTNDAIVGMTAVMDLMSKNAQLPSLNADKGSLSVAPVNASTKDESVTNTSIAAMEAMKMIVVS